MEDATSPAMKSFANGVRSFSLPMHANSWNGKIVRVILGNSITCVMSFRDHRTFCGEPWTRMGRGLLCLCNSDAWKYRLSIIAYWAARPFGSGRNGCVHKG